MISTPLALESVLVEDITLVISVTENLHVAPEPHRRTKRYRGLCGILSIFGDYLHERVLRSPDFFRRAGAFA